MTLTISQRPSRSPDLIAEACRLFVLPSFCWKGEEEAMSQKYYVYVYLDPRHYPPEPVYVGKGHGKRAWAHLSWTHNAWLRRKLQRIRRAGLEPVVEILQKGLTAGEANEQERLLIAQHGRADQGKGTLCNFTDGGEGTPGRVPTPETRALWSQQRSRPQTPAQYAANCARTQTAQSRSRISEATKGHQWHTPGQIEAIQRSNATRKVSEETRTKMSVTRKAKGLSGSRQEKMRTAKKRAQESRTPEEQAAIVEKTASKNRGKKRSEETKRKLKEAWARRREKWGPSGQPPREQ